MRPLPEKGLASCPVGCGPDLQSWPTVLRIAAGSALVQVAEHASSDQLLGARRRARPLTAPAARQLDRRFRPRITAVATAGAFSAGSKRDRSPSPWHRAWSPRAPEAFIMRRPGPSGAWTGTLSGRHRRDHPVRSARARPRCDARSPRTDHRSASVAFVQSASPVARPGSPRRRGPSPSSYPGSACARSPPRCSIAHSLEGSFAVSHASVVRGRRPSTHRSFDPRANSTQARPPLRDRGRPGRRSMDSVYLGLA